METKKLMEYGVSVLVSLVGGYNLNTLEESRGGCQWPCHIECSPTKCECVCPPEPEIPYSNSDKDAKNYSATEQGSDNSAGLTNLSEPSDEPRLFASIFKIDYKK
ncbi:hypothetical protein J4417_01230 [Candidatus Woesearchaeota archaeon]|nr:hypothetical protein [Candidatus Woesearchaeota archaeon]